MAAFILAGTIFTFVSCQKELPLGNSDQATASEPQVLLSKEPVTRAYRDSFDIAMTFVPDAGWVYPNSWPAWFYGTGDGNATHMGNVNSYFNSHTTKSSTGVTMVYGRPVTQYYATEVARFNIPASLVQHVHAVIYDDKENSIWVEIAPEGMPSWHPDAIHVGMAGRALIVGGTGKFAGATGETTLNCYFSKINLKGSMWQNGRITY